MEVVIEMRGKKNVYAIIRTEVVIDSHGVERIYGYTMEGVVIFLNALEVERIYEAKGIRKIKRVIR